MHEGDISGHLCNVKEQDYDEGITSIEPNRVSTRVSLGLNVGCLCSEKTDIRLKNDEARIDIWVIPFTTSELCHGVRGPRRWPIRGRPG